MRIGYRLTLLVLLMVVVPLALIGYLAFDLSRRALEQSMHDHLMATNLNKMTEIRRWLNADQRLLAALAQRPLVRDHATVLRNEVSDAVAYQAAKGRLYADHLIPNLLPGYFTELELLDANSGKVLVSTDPAAEGLSRANETYLIAGREQLYVDTIRYFPTETRPALHLSAPVIARDGELVGVLVGHANLAELTQIVTQHSGHSASQDSYLVNATHYFVTEPRFGSEFPLQQSFSNPAIENAVRRGSGIAHYQSYRGQPATGAFDWLSELQVAIITQVDQSEVFKPIVALRDTIILGSLLVALVAAALGLLIALNITLPLTLLVTGAREIGLGNLEHRITIRRRDEIGWLARAFNQMAAALAHKDAELRDYTLKLEERVAERTIALQQSEVRFRSLFDNSLDGIALAEIVTDETGRLRDFRFLEVNRAAEELIGARATEIRGKQFTEILPILDKAPWLQAFDAVITDGQPTRFMQFGASEDRHFEIAAFLPAEGQLAAIISDVTERVRSEATLRRQNELLQTILDTIPVMIDYYDPEGHFLWGNRGWERTLGWSVAEAQMPDASFVRYPDAESRAATQAAIRRGDGTWADFKMRTRSGAVLDTTWANVRLSNGMTVGIGLDITERKQAEAQLRQTLVELKRSNSDLEKFAYVASHDLQEPLRMVASFVQLLAMRYQGQLDADADEFIGYAVEGAKRMQKLLLDLQEYSQLGISARPFVPIASELALAQALHNLTITIQESNATATHDPLPVVMADAVQLTQLFQNLIDNAIKFRGAAVPRIHVSAKEATGSSETPATWEFAVSDNGIGIACEYHKRIFGLFQRLNSREEYPGTGIGLAVCKKIVERHGGQIWVESAPGSGATLYFTIPASQSGTKGHLAPENQGVA